MKDIGYDLETNTFYINGHISEHKYKSKLELFIGGIFKTVTNMKSHVNIVYNKSLIIRSPDVGVVGIIGKEMLKKHPIFSLDVVCNDFGVEVFSLGFDSHSKYNAISFDDYYKDKVNPFKPENS